MDMLSYLLGKKSGGGGQPASSPWTKLAEQDFTVSTSSTSATDVGTIACGSAAWTKAKMVYVRVRDKAGKRDGYFFGSDSFFAINTSSEGSPCEYCGRIIIRASGGLRSYGYSNSNFAGVVGYSISNTGDVLVKAQYNSNYSKTIDGTFHVEVYTLEWPDNVSPYA